MPKSLALLIPLALLPLPVLAQAVWPGAVPPAPSPGGIPYRAPVPPTSPLQPLPVTAPGEVPPLINRAIAPPVGDLSVAANRVPSTNVTLPSGSQRIQGFQSFRRKASSALTLLMAGRGLNIVFQNEGDGTAPAGANYDPLITVNLGGTTLNEAFNSILRAAGLKAVRNGNTIIVGRFLSGDAIGLASRTVRLNQAKAEVAATFLNLQGASVSTITVPKQYLPAGGTPAVSSATPASTPGSAATVVSNTNNTVPYVVQEAGPVITNLTPPSDPGSYYPLRGLTATADPRLNQITVVGPLELVNLALSYLQQLDLRKRQVQINVKVVDLNLDDLNAMNSSFSFRVGDTFVTNTNGVLGVTTGGAVPTLTNPLTNLNSLGNSAAPAVPSGTISDPVIAITPPSPYPQGATGVLPNPAYPAAPFLLQPNFLGALQAAVTNRNAKVLTDPTLVIQEGENSSVRITEKIVSFLNCQTTGSTGNTAIATVTPVLEDVGLKLGVQVDKIDDNGFVTVQVTPDLSAPVSQQDLGPCVAGGARQIVTLTQNRVTNSGRVRLRDGQTLVLSGVIQDFQRTQTVKFPLLGDLPVFGALFRSTEDTRQRREIVVVLTPRIIDDTDLARFGYRSDRSGVN